MQELNAGTVWSLYRDGQLRGSPLYSVNTDINTAVGVKEGNFVTRFLE